MAWFTIPRHFAYLVDARTLGPNDETLVTHPNLGLPGGWVTTRLEPSGLTGVNTVVQDRHVLAGTVTRSLIVTPSGQLAIATVGVGVSPVSQLIDDANEPLGRNVFNALDGHAADRLRRSFPGC